MPAVPRRPGPRSSARASTAPGQRRRRGLRGSSGEQQPQEGTGPGRAMGTPQPRARWSDTGGLSNAWQGEPARWLASVCVLLAWGYFSSSFWVLLFLKLRGLQSRHPTTPASCSGPESGTRGASGARRAPSPLHDAHGSASPEAAAGSRREALGQPPVPGFPSKPLRVALLACLGSRVRAGRPRLCRCRERGRLSLPPLSPAPRGIHPDSEVSPSLSALEGFLGCISCARRGGLAVWEKAERRLRMLQSLREIPICLLLAGLSPQPLSTIIITIAINYPSRSMCLSLQPTVPSHITRGSQRARSGPGRATRHRRGAPTEGEPRAPLENKSGGHRRC